MDEISDDDETLQITIKRPFTPKFFKQLNYQQNEKMKKSKRKTKATTPVSSQKMELMEKVGGLTQLKSTKKLQEINRNGNRILANWKNDQINGQAEIYYHNGVTFKGIYQNGVKVKGHFKFLNGYQYIGHCLGNKFYGEGSLIFPSGKIISGEWKEYNILGNGKIQYPHGQVYYGEIANFKKHGKGYLFLSDGSKYVGEFNNGLISGSGTYFLDDEPVSKGIWENGELIKSVDLSQINEQSIEIQEMDNKAEQIEKQIKNKSKENKENKEKVSSISDYLTADQDATNHNKRVHFED